MSLGIFTAPKAFVGHFGVIQRNAIKSWTLISPTPRVALLGDEPGTKEVCDELGVEHIPTVTRNVRGTPLIADIFEKAEAVLQTEVLCYANADIILLSDLTAAAHSVSLERYLIVGRRVDLNIEVPLDFVAPEWEEKLRKQATSSGHLHAPTGLDYFVFRRGTIGHLPHFAVGRPAWDNHMIYLARKARTPVIDATDCILAIHQNHDYSHVQGGVEEAFRGDEAQLNLKIAGQPEHWLDIRDATWRLDPKGLSKVRPWTSRRYWTVTLPALHPLASKVSNQIRRLRRWLSVSSGPV